MKGSAGVERGFSQGCFEAVDIAKHLFPSLLSRNRSEREVRAAAVVLQTVWGYKELRKPLEKEGWKKSDFQVWGVVVEYPVVAWVLLRGEGAPGTQRCLISALLLLLSLETLEGVPSATSQWVDGSGAETLCEALSLEYQI